MSIPRHKVFISYFHKDDQFYKKQTLEMSELNENWQKISIFDDYSVHEDEVDADDSMSDEQIRREIRDNYISSATVLILLCGEHTKERKYIDWEIQAAMTDTENNPRMGVVVINLPSVEHLHKVRSSFGDEDKQYFPYTNWVMASNDYTTVKKEFPYLPERIIKNMIKEGVRISVVNWSSISNNPQKLKGFIDVAYNHRSEQKYDVSEPLRRRNS